MTRPEFVAARGIYRLDWGASEYVRIEFDLLRNSWSGGGTMVDAPRKPPWD